MEGGCWCEVLGRTDMVATCMIRWWGLGGWWHIRAWQVECDQLDHPLKSMVEFANGWLGIISALQAREKSRRCFLWKTEPVCICGFQRAVCHPEIQRNHS